MAQPRSQLVCVKATPYYHITTRCVRRAFLCGQDTFTGQCFEHRRQWIEDRIRLLSSIFAIDVCAYAVMSNHYHLVLKINLEEAKQWTRREVVKRWCSLFKGPLLIQKYARDEALSAAEWDAVESMVSVYAGRLADLSWFMKCLNEFVARKSNAEDDVTGHFWEARFSSEALCTDEALLTCMAYVDLNPVRAAMAATPEDSRHTSIYERHRNEWPLRRTISDVTKDQGLQDVDLLVKPLLRFNDDDQRSAEACLPISFKDYAELVDWSGRAVREGKRGAISAHAVPILARLSLSSNQWLDGATGFERRSRSKAAVVLKRI